MSDGTSDTSCPRFDPGGKYLWFLARTDVGYGESEGMTSIGRPTASSVYGVVLQKDRPSPVAPQSDEEPDAGVFAVEAPKDEGHKEDRAKGEPAKGQHGAAEKGEGGKGSGEKKEAPPVKIDFEGIDQRIVALPIDRANYRDLAVGTEGVLFLVTAPMALSDESLIDMSREPPPGDILRFDLKKRKAERFVEGIDGGRWRVFLVTDDGKKVLYAKGRKLFFAGADEPPGDKAKALDTSRLEVWVDPRAEWRQIYHEVFRIERDFLYDERAHGLDLAATEALYAPWVEGLGGRADLNALVGQALSNLGLGHVRMTGGSMPEQGRVNVGLLGADYSVADGRYRFARILSGENWNPGLRAPLTQPGVEVKEGDFLPARRRSGGDLRRRRVPLLPGHGRQADGDRGGTARRRRRIPPGGGRPDGVGGGAAAPHLDGGQPEEGRRALARQGRSTCSCPTRRSRDMRASTATSSPRSTRTRR